MDRVRNQRQCTLSYTPDHPDWIVLNELTERNLTAKPGAIARLFVGERLHLYRAGWKPEDVAMMTRLETIVRLKEEHLKAFDEFVRGLATKEVGRKAGRSGTR